MPFIGPRGNPTSRIWIIFAKPYGSDKGTLLSGGMGHVFFKMLQEADISQTECYFTSRAPNTDDAHAYANLDGELSFSTPPIILVIGDEAGWFLPELREPKSMETAAGQLQKYAGSLLTCQKLQYQIGRAHV